MTDVPQTHDRGEEGLAPDDAGGAEAPDRIHLDLSGREPTGDAEVDAVLERWVEVDGHDLQTQLDTAERAQASLQQRLADTGE